MTAHMGIAPTLQIALNGAVSLGNATFGQYRPAPPEIPPIDDLGFLEELAAELDGGAFDMGDLLLDDLQLPAAGARAASTVLVPPSLASYFPAPACGCGPKAICGCYRSAARPPAPRLTVVSACAVSPPARKL